MSLIRVDFERENSLKQDVILVKMSLKTGLNGKFLEILLFKWVLRHHKNGFVNRYIMIEVDWSSKTPGHTPIKMWVKFYLTEAEFISVITC